ncbi:MAG: AbrB/MazE/SpoVT family DNA-binding domain-containing protein [Gallionella sp.]|nr:AbrB/MazE/SpoVT family DNA-binding domain-containing protein [Gallionella sp.]MDD4959501.1 AbrB/MazE/SpoVT family DNA-binding domain-containing protein [Gallionella sp.]
MHTTLTRKGQVTIPKHIRDAIGLTAGCAVRFDVNGAGEVVIHKASADAIPFTPDRFEAARGTADIKWRTDELMALLRGDD